MIMTKLWSVLLGLVLAALALMSIAPSAGAVGVQSAADLQAAAATPSSVLVGQECPDVMVIGARGTNEEPTKNPNSLPAYVKDPYHGVGATVDSLFVRLAAANPQLIFSLEPAIFPAVFGGTTFSEFLNNAGQYLTDAQAGAASIAGEIRDTDMTCGLNKVHYILAGYSLGAWAVHDALYDINSAQLNEIAGVALFGDPLFEPFSSIDQTIDISPGIAVPADPEDVSIPPSPQSPPSLVARIGSWCFLTDPVCQGPEANQAWSVEVAACVVDAAANNTDLPCSHLDYYDIPPTETAQAAAFLQPFLPPPTAPDTPGNVTAVATSQYAIKVTWTEATADVTGFNIDNGCPVGSCDPGATLAQTTGPVDSATFAVTPGSYQCFRVQALNKAGASPWSGFGCISTPGLVLSATQEWTNTKVTVPAGDELGISADGQVTVSPTESVGPAGDPSCTPAQQYPGAAFPAPGLPCYSLIARIGNGTPFEVGTSTLVTVAASGTLFLGINDDSFSGNSGSWNVKIKLGGLP